MREIKFRVWDGKLKMFTGLCDSNIIDGNKIGSSLGSNVVEQYTGLTDKNGVEIYEGDVIHAFGAPLEVKWIVDGWFADCELTGVCEAGQEWDDNCEVIGNIHEDLGLLD